MEGIKVGVSQSLKIKESESQIVIVRDKIAKSLI